MIRAGIIGDFDKSYIHHINTNNALHHAAQSLMVSIEITWLPTDKIQREDLTQFDLLWCAPGSPYVSMNGALTAIRFAREHNVPFIGTCGGFQHTVIEYARNVLEITDAEHAENNPGSKNLFITPLLCSVKGQSLDVILEESSLAFKSYYNKQTVKEEYHCNYGLNDEYRYALTQSGLEISGIDNSNEARILELPANDFFIATLFLPQSLSTETNPHSLIIHLLMAADTFRKLKLIEST
jgi:CTP synthase (UTP-ammonia lyase)